MKSYKIFALNPGSTSTKLAMFEDDKPLFITKAVHTADELAKYPKIKDQFAYRRDTILKAVEEQGATLEGVSRAEAEEKMLTAIARIVPDFKR